MKRHMLIVSAITFIFVMVLSIGVAYAADYEAVYTQLDEDIIVKEAINGSYSPIYTLNNYLEISGSSYYFVKKVVFNQDFDNATIRLNLDYGVVVEDQKVYPSRYNIESDGETISIIWNFENVKTGQEVAVFVTLNDTKQDSLIEYWAIAAILIIFFGVLFYFKSIKNKKTRLSKNKKKYRAAANLKKSEQNYDFLLDTEKRVIEELKKADRNELWQKQIQDSTQYSKAKVSRLIRNLEARGLVVKIPFGNTNKVRLKS